MEKAREEQPPPSLGMVVGENLRRLRKDMRWTQDVVAREVAATGLNWKRTNIADLESGRRETVDLGTVLVLAAALDKSVSDFFAGEGDVLVTPRAEYPQHAASMTREGIRKELAGEDGTLRLIGPSAVEAFMDREAHLSRKVPAEADIALAKRLDTTPWTVINAAEGLWGRSLTEERNRRVAKLGDIPIGERQARQGHITRELTAQLQTWMEEGEGPADG